MNLYLRLIWTLLRTRRLPRIDVRDELERTFRVLPNDLDINRHMNNGRYLTMIDLMVIEYFARTGFLRVLLKNRWHPIVGGSVITYRRELKLGQQYKLRFRWDGSDEFWNYLHFEFVSMDGRICASGYTKGAAASRRGLVRNQVAFEKLGEDFAAKPALPQAVMHWINSEKALMEQIAAA